MNDITVIKPRPGSRQKPAASGVDSGPEDRTAFQAAPQAGEAVSFRLPASRLGPVADEASRLLSLAARLGEAGKASDPSGLRRRCASLVRDYRAALQRQHYAAATIDMASYCLCALVDELALNSDWGEDSDWAAQSLLSEFHAQTWAGTHFFELVDQACKTNDTELMVLQYLCLALGFKGRYRVEEDGQEALDRYRETLYTRICSERGAVAGPFDRSWESRIRSGSGLGSRTPIWVMLSVMGAVLLLAYLLFARNLSLVVQPTLNGLSQLGVPVAAASGEAPQGQLRYLSQLLQTEVDRGLLTLDQQGSRIRLRIGNEALFPSGQAQLREGMIPVLGKIARALENTEGTVQVTGHTDDRPISTVRYPSNWHLSLARATAVSNQLAAGANLSGRLWPEGRGASEPLAPNDTPENRARNRRVEITLIP